MSISELITFLSASLTTLNGAKADAERRGDMVEIARLAPLVVETELTLAQIKTLS